MAMTDTYSTHPETHLATDLANAARNELATCMREQRLLPWLEIDEVVSKGEVRLFEMIENAGDYVLTNGNRELWSHPYFGISLLIWATGSNNVPEPPTPTGGTPASNTSGHYERIRAVA